MKTAPFISRCSNCQYSTLRNFTGISTHFLASKPIRFASTVARSSRSTNWTRRHYTQPSQSESTTFWRPGPIDNGSPAPYPSDADHPVLSGDSDAMDNSPVPWYLQEQRPRRTPSDILERQKLPDLPKDPPHRLKPILEYLSKDIGLEYLTFLDARKLDPPPALGGNFIMLIGTGRSEKHLHNAAHKFCRWVRGTYKLAPYADGLLGRNELKIKMRRKARRAKLLGSARAMKKPDEDDGISTGWICVNVGVIEPNEHKETLLEDENGMVGFGTSPDGTKLVVQMMTAEKREELDLESLWTGYLRRQQRNEEQVADEDQVNPQADVDVQGEVGLIDRSASRPVADASMVNSSLRPAEHSREQRRGLHSSAQLPTAPSLANANMNEVKIQDGDFSSNLDPLRQGTAESTKDASRQSVAQLQESLDYLRSLSDEEAINALGHGPSDHSSTPFLVSFYGLIPIFPDAEHWHKRFQLVLAARQLCHPGYGLHHLVDILNEMQLSNVPISVGILESFADAIIHVKDPQDQLPLESASPPGQNLLGTLSVLELWTLGGVDFPNETILLGLHVAVIKARRATTKSQVEETAIWRIGQFLSQNQLHLKNPSSHALILEELASQGEWAEYWRYWRGIARNLDRRPQLLYSMMFRHVAEMGHQSNCIGALEEWIPELDLEQPPVQIAAELSRSILYCLEVADPDVVRQFEDGSNEKGQWVRLWKRCLGGLEQPSEIIDPNVPCPSVVDLGDALERPEHANGTKSSPVEEVIEARSSGGKQARMR